MCSKKQYGSILVVIGYIIRCEIRVKVARCVRVMRTKEKRATQQHQKKKRNGMKHTQTNTQTLSAEDCGEMMRILLHPDVQGCFASTSVLTALSSPNHQDIHNALRGEERVQKLLTNTALIQRISAMHIKMKGHDRS